MEHDLRARIDVEEGGSGVVKAEARVVPVDLAELLCPVDLKRIGGEIPELEQRHAEIEISADEEHHHQKGGVRRQPGSAKRPGRIDLRGRVGRCHGLDHEESMPPAYHPPMPKPFASSADLAAKEATLEQLADGVFAYTAQGDPNVGSIVGTDAILAIEARATPYMAQQWIDVVRDRVSDLPFGDLVLTHYHAVRTLGASAFGARRIVAHAGTKALIDERGEEDWASEQGRMPRLFAGAETIPGLTHPTDTFEDAMTLDLGNRRVELRHLGRGHTSGDIVVWLPDERILFAGDLVEAQAAPYMGDAHVVDWSTATLDSVAALGPGSWSAVGGRS